MAKRRNFINDLPLAPVFALLFGTAIAVLIAVAPLWRLEQAVDATGLASVLSVARPPLGLKARLLAVMLAFALVAIFVWVAVTVVERLIAGKTSHESVGDDALDLGRFGEALPPIDAPRRPIFADRELGAPFMSDEALAGIAAPHRLQALPEENAPLVVVSNDQVSAEAVLAQPSEAGEIVSSEAIGIEPSTPQLQVTPDADETLEAPLEIAEFDIASAPDEPAQLAGETSIEALIRRLEAGLARRAGPPSPPPSSTVNELTVMRDLMALNREREVPDDIGSARALDTLQRMVAHRMAS